jgi:DNA-binding response OmpR family regulator
MPHSRPVLVLEDDAAVAATIGNALLRDGWQIETAGSLAEARCSLDRNNPRIAANG